MTFSTSGINGHQKRRGEVEAFWGMKRHTGREGERHMSKLLKMTVSRQQHGEERDRSDSRKKDLYLSKKEKAQKLSGRRGQISFTGVAKT